MRWLIRIIVSGVLLLAAPSVFAACNRTNGSTFACQSEPEAYSALTGLSPSSECNRYQSGYTADGGVKVTKFNPTSYRGELDCSVEGHFPVTLSFTATFDANNTCKNRPDFNGPFPGSLSGTPVSGSMQCDGGCWKLWTPNGDGSWNGSNALNAVCDPKDNSCSYVSGFHYNANLAMCEPNPPDSCPKGKIKGPNGHCIDNQCPDGMTLQADGTCGPSANECPSGQIKSPAGGCLPGEGQCAAGEVRGADGTCKKDGNGDGEPDEPGEGDKSQFSGGDNCENPPSCSGDAIMCGQARIQWRIDCNTRKNRNVSGGMCSSTPICTGEKCDSMEYSSMLFQWRSACAAEKLLAKAGEGGGDSGIKDHMTAMKQAEVNALRSLGTDDGHSGVDPKDIWAKDADYGQDKITETLFGSGGGSCDLSFTIGGRLVTPPPQFWRICSIIHWLMVAAAYLWVAFKMGG